MFGEIVSADMKVVDAIAALQRVNGGGAFTEFPIRQPPVPGDTLQTVKSVLVSNIVRFPEPTTFVLGSICCLAICCCRGVRDADVVRSVET